MSADDTQASEWERRGAEIAVGHLYLSLGNCACGWSVALDGNPPSWKAQWAEHLMAAFREAGLAATERETTNAPVWGKRQTPCGLVSHWADGVGGCTCREITGWQPAERDCTPWREVTP